MGSRLWYAVLMSQETLDRKARYDAANRAKRAAAKRDARRLKKLATEVHAEAEETPAERLQRLTEGRVYRLRDGQWVTQAEYQAKSDADHQRRVDEAKAADAYWAAEEAKLKAEFPREWAENQMMIADMQKDQVAKRRALLEVCHSFGVADEELLAMTTAELQVKYESLMYAEGGA
jgi:hypothetical protein